MSDSIQLKKLKRMMYQCLRWRLQLPNYVPHNPIPHRDDPRLSEFSKGVICAYADLMRDIDKIENSENQRRVYRKNKRDFFPMFGNKDDGEEDFVEEMRWERRDLNE